MQFIQTLESRRLLSASGLTIVADETKLLGDARTIRSDVQHFAPLLKTDERVIQNDLRGLPNNATNRTLTGTLRGDVQAGIGKLRRDVGNLIRVGSSDARKAVADGISLFFNPTNASAQSRLAADITRLQNETAAPLAALLTDAAAFQSKITQDLTALSNANPTNTALHNDVQAANGHTSSALTTAQHDVTTVQTDLATLLHDLA